MNIFKRTIITLSLAGFLLVPLAALAVDSYGIVETGKSSGLSSLPVSKSKVPELIGSFVSGGLALIGIVFFLLLLYGGIMWMTALGKTEQVDKAKEILEKAIVGLVIVSASYAIASFVFGSLSGQGQGAGCCSNSGCTTAVTDADMCVKEGGTPVSDCSKCVSNVSK